MSQPSPAWIPQYRCCWCRAEFVQIELDNRRPWVCPNEECFSRCLAFKMNDIAGNLFFFPMPKIASLIEAIESQRYGAIDLGGSRSGGKSHGGRAIAYRYCQKFEDFEVYFLRREMPQLRRNHIKRAIVEAERLGAKLVSGEMRFPKTGSTLEFGHCADLDDWKNFVGSEGDLVVFEQLEQFTEDQFTEIGASTGRRRRDGWRGLNLSLENPGGPLAGFIETFFVNKNPDPLKYPDYDPNDYHFIESDLEDNPYTDERYVKNLARLKPERREMYRWGRRDVFPGQYFREFDPMLHVGKVDVPSEIPRLGGMRWGYMTPGIFLWSVVLPDGRLYIEREYPFTETLAKDVAVTIRAITATFGQTLLASYGNRDMQDGEGSEDIFETLAKNKLVVQASKHDPVIGWQRVRHWLGQIPTTFGPSGAVVETKPGVIIHPDCTTLIKTLPQLLSDPKHPEDVNEQGATFAAKALRYICMSRPHPLAMAQVKAYPTGSAGELMQQLVNGSGPSVLGRYNVR